MAWKILAQPTNEPVSLDEAKLHLRLDDSGEDALVSGLIRAARETVERMTGRSTTNRYCSQTFAAFGSGLELQYPPVSAVSGVGYYDVSGTSGTVAASGYQASLDSLPPVLTVAPDCDWPGVQTGRDLPITVTYVAGYGASGADVPEAMRLAMKMMIGHWYRNRENVNIGNITNEIPFTVQALLYPLRAHGAEA